MIEINSRPVVKPQIVTRRTVSWGRSRDLSKQTWTAQVEPPGLASCIQGLQAQERVSVGQPRPWKGSMLSAAFMILTLSNLENGAGRCER